MAADPSSDERVEHVVDRGLRVTGAGREVALGDAHTSRFGAGGSLFFERSEDDGHHVLTSETWVLEAGSVTPRPLRRGERAAAPTPLAGGVDAPVRICIDPGHGGSQPGAAGFGYLEKDMNLDMALHLRDFLLADSADPFGGGDWEVLMTRASDVTVSLPARTQLANAWGADRFLSIHCNGFFDPAANGTETYAYAEGTVAASMRDRVQEEMLSAWHLFDRGVKTANFYVLVYTDMPASLSETGFITSPIDIQKISDPAARRDMALAHLFALQRHFGYEPHEPWSGEPTYYCVPKVSSLICTPIIDYVGTPTLTGPDDFHVTAHTILGSQFGIFLWGHEPASTPFGGGTLCIGPPFVRTPVQNSGGTFCNGTFDYFFSQAYMTQHGLGAGSAVFGQYWFRDPFFPPPENIGLTGGLAFVIGS